MSRVEETIPARLGGSGDDSLDAAIERLARTPELLVATDYDGTIAPIVEDPSAARPLREAIVAARGLSAMSHTHVAAVSGRSLAELAKLSGFTEPIMLVGSHGSEFDHDFARTLSNEQKDLLDRVVKEFERIAAEGEGFRVEVKPASAAFHYRNANEADAARAVEAIKDGPASWEGVHTKTGKMVIELAVLATSKGDAIDTIRHRVGAAAVLYLGDDVTDEDAFARLRGPDVGVKVGEGETGASFRISDPHEVARLLARLVELRQAWIDGSEAVPIEHHALLSDGRSLALVAPGARLTWLCLPRLDSPAMFAELVGGPADGHFTVEPASGAAGSSHAYDGDSLVLKTEWPTLTVTDFLDCTGGKPTQRAGRTDLIRYLEGSGEVKITFAPRIDFGRVATRISLREGGLEIEGTNDPIVLRAPGVEWELIEEGKHQTAVGRVTLDGGPLRLELRYGTGTLRERNSGSFGERYRLTKSVWESWADGLTLPRERRELVLRSALTLKALCYGPSGGIAAAATTSLPEHLGGVRNWDYRYCWPRDASMSAAALVKLGSQSEAMGLLDWLLTVLDRTIAPDRLMPLYTVTGHEVGAEAELTELAGYCGSRPVRVGNGARGQVQLDVFGPIAELIWQCVQAEAPLSTQHWRLTQAMAQAVASRWQEPDHGIWEIRKPRRHHLHSKVMGWMTVDRAIKVSDRFLDRAQPEWESLRDEIAQDVLDNAWNERAGAYTAAYGAEDLDAAALWIGLSGLVACDSDRFVRTIEAIERELRDGPTVYRYIADDGLPGREGGFFICASWLVEAMWRCGRRDDARALFDELCELAGPTGLIPEQYDPSIARTLGNHPQAYSHLGLIENAILLSAE